MTSSEIPDRYHDEVDSLVDGFRHELCSDCGRDLAAHIITPDALGKPHAWCLLGSEEQESIDRARAKIVASLLANEAQLDALREALAAVKVAAGFSTMAELAALSRALDCALARWPEIPER